MSLPVLLLACIVVATAGWAATGAVMRLLRRHGLYDRPNTRSSHENPTPRGGGLALIPVVLLALAAARGWGGSAPPGLAAVVGGAALLALVSWIDDLRNLPVGLRLLVHGAAVALGLVPLAAAGPVFQGWLPPWLDMLAAGMLWLWFVNLFNFMDGIDGISGVEAISIGLGLVSVGLLLGWPIGDLAAPALVAAATAGFLVWNWAPARVFLGDVGSVPLGYLLGWLLLAAAIEGQWAVAVILPLYYLADATITLARRALRGETVWQAHRDHAYQRAARGGRSHATVSAAIALCNAVLIACALAAARGWPVAALVAAAAAVGALLLLLERRARHGA